MLSMVIEEMTAIMISRMRLVTKRMKLMIKRIWMINNYIDMLFYCLLNNRKLKSNIKH